MIFTEYVENYDFLSMLCMKILLYWQTDDFTTLLLASFFHLVVVYINFLKADLEDDEEEVEVSSMWKALNRIDSTKHEFPIYYLFACRFQT